MKVTNGEILLIREALGKLNSLRIPAVLSFKLARLSNRVNVCFQDMEVTRVKLVNQYGVKGDGGTVSVELASSEDKEKFWEEYAEVLRQEVELEPEVIKLPEDLEIEPSTLMPLERFIEM